MPNKSAPITLYFNSRGEWGWQLKLLRLYLNEGSNPLRLYVEADIE